MGLAHAMLAAPVVTSLCGCALFALPVRDVAPASEWVLTAVEELGKGHFASAEDILSRARARYPEDEGVLRWSVEVHRMQWRFVEAIDFLLELSRSEHLVSLTRREVNGQIGDLLFAIGEYGQSTDYLLPSRGGAAESSRQAKAVVSLALRHSRKAIEHRSTESAIFVDPWPSMPCTFGNKDRLCVLDTGSTMTTLAKSLAEEVGVYELQDFGLVRDSLGQKHGSMLGVLPEFSVGGVAIAPMPVLVVDDERLSLRDTFGGPKNPPQAVIGMDVLSRFRVVFDLTSEKVRLEKPQGLTDKRSERCLWVEGCIVFPAQIDAVAMWFILDTAASHSSLTKAGLQALPGGEGRALPDLRHPKSIAGRGFITRKVGGMVVQSSAVKFTGVDMPVIDRRGDGYFPIHGVLGVDLIRHCRLTLDSGRILLEQFATTDGADKR